MSRNIAATLVAFIVNLSITFFLTPFIVGSIGLEAYGFVSLGLNFINYANLAMIALNSMAGRFISIEYHKNNWIAANRFLTSILLADLLAGSVVTVLGVTIILRLEYVIDLPIQLEDDVKRLFVLLVANYFLGMIGALFSIGTFATNRLYFASLRQAESRVIQAGTLLLLFSIFHPSLAYVGLGYIAATVYTTLFSVFYTRKLTPQLSVARRFLDIDSLMTVFRAGIWNTIVEMSYVLLRGLDLLIVNIYLGATAMGMLALAKTVPSAIATLVGAVSLVFLPAFTRAFAVSQLDALVLQVSRSIRILSVVSSLPIAVLISLGEVLYTLWVPTEDARTLQVLSIVIIAELVFSGPTNGVSLLFTVTNRLRANATVLAVLGFFNISVIVIVLSATNIGLYGVVLVSTILSIGRSLLFTAPFGAICLGLSSTVFFRQIARGILLFSVTTFVGFGFRYVIVPDTWLLLAVCAGGTAVIGIVVSWVAVFEGEERLYLRARGRRIMSLICRGFGC